MVLQSRRVWLAGQFVPAQLEVADGKIVNVYPFGTKTADVDYGNKRIVPGFIDVHTPVSYTHLRLTSEWMFSILRSVDTTAR